MATQAFGPLIYYGSQLMSTPGFNPYAAPQNVMPPVVAQPVGGPPGGVWRNRNLLVMHRMATLPPRCVKSNEPTERWLKRKLYWHAPWIYLAIIPGVLVYAILASILSFRATIHIGLSEKWIWRRRWTMLISWMLVFLGIGLFFVAANVESQGAAVPVLVISGIVLFLGSMIFGLIACRLVHVKKMDHHYIWLKGVHPDYLALLPEWPYPG